MNTIESDWRKAFNARSLSPRQVANSFVFTRKLHELASTDNTLLIGPRGSGKTTLMKMLLESASDEWRKSDPRNSFTPPYTGVFVPYDRSWGKQVQSFKSNHDDEARIAAENAAFVTHTIKQLLKSVEYKTSRLTDDGSPLSPDTEAKMALEIAEFLRIKITVPSIPGLQSSLSSRLLRISDLKHSNGATDLVPRLELVTLLNACVEAIDRHLGNPDRKWAMLFDELEMAPNEIMKTLWDSLRGSSGKLIFKLSMAPFGPRESRPSSFYQAAEDHDFNVVKLWYAKKEEGYGFTKTLMRQTFSHCGVDNTSIDELLGDSLFRLRGDDFEYKPVKALAKKDRGFRRYLINSGIDPDDPSSAKRMDKAKIIRKANSAIILRNEYRRPDRSDGRPSRPGQIRTGVTPRVFTGADSIFAICEGNPRNIIGLTSRLARRISSTPNTTGTPLIPRSVQAEEVKNLCNRFRALIGTIPLGETTSAPRGALAIIDKIGEYIFREVVTGPFNANYKSYFTIDDRMEPSAVETLGTALDIGALIHVPSKDGEEVVTGIVGCKFRLSYTLAPHFRIPMVLTKHFPLSRIWGGETNPVTSEEAANDDASTGQLDLFRDSESSNGN